MERDRKLNQRNDTLPGSKTRNKKPTGTKKKKKNRKRTPRTKAGYRAPRIRALARLT